MTGVQTCALPIFGIEDISGFVAEQRANAESPHDRLVTPREKSYPVDDHEVAARLGLL